jgi:hypothetical protein
VGKIYSGILSKVSGKIAGVVGGSWKDKAYLRAYVIPANPNTAGQQAQRTKFQMAVAFAQLLVGQIFNVYTDQFQKSMSGFNYFIRQNISKFVGSNWFLNIVITNGKLAKAILTGATYDPSTGSTEVTWSTAPGANGKNTDPIMGFVYNSLTGAGYFFDATSTRAAGTKTWILPTALTYDHLYIYLFAAQYVGTKLDMISDSDARIFAHV